MSDVSRYTQAIPPLSTIKDADTRRVLEAIVNGWRTRNGELKPNSDERFITKGELKKLVEDVNSGYFGPNGAGSDLIGGQDEVSTPVQEYVRQLLQATTDDILNNQLWVKLGERIPLVDLPNIFNRVDYTETVVRQEITERKSADAAIVTSVTQLGARVGTNEAGLSNEISVRANSDNALVEAVNKIWSTVGTNTAIVAGGSNVTSNAAGANATNWNQVQAQVRDPVTGQFLGTAAVRDQALAEVDLVKGRLTAERTIKVDTNGYVAGIGVIATKDMNTGAASSSVIVRADRFAVGTASGPGITPRVPFKVYTTNVIAPDGVTVITPGVYMDEAVIGNGTIGTAKIGVASIDTLKIKGEAVTQTRYNQAIVVGNPSSNPGLTSVTIDVPAGIGPVSVVFTGTVTFYPSTFTLGSMSALLYVNGTQVMETAAGYDGLAVNTTAVAGVVLGQGSHTIGLGVTASTSYPSTTMIGSLIVQAGFR